MTRTDENKRVILFIRITDLAAVALEFVYNSARKKAWYEVHCAYTGIGGDERDTTETFDRFDHALGYYEAAEKLCYRRCDEMKNEEGDESDG